MVGYPRSAAGVEGGAPDQAGGGHPAPVRVSREVLSTAPGIPSMYYIIVVVDDNGGGGGGGLWCPPFVLQHRERQGVSPSYDDVFFAVLVTVCRIVFYGSFLF